MPRRCTTCCSFGHDDEMCTKRVIKAWCPIGREIVIVIPTVDVEACKQSNKQNDQEIPGEQVDSADEGEPYGEGQIQQVTPIKSIHICIGGKESEQPETSNAGKEENVWKAKQVKTTSSHQP